MKQSIENIKTIEVTRAVRSTQIGGLKIKKKQIISLLDNELTAVGDDTAEAIMDTLDKIDLEKNEIVTLYYGMDITRAEGEKVLAAAIRDRYPKLQVEIVRGDQPDSSLYYFGRIARRIGHLAVKIVTDSLSDLTSDLVGSLDITVVPSTVLFGTQEISRSCYYQHR